MPEKKYLAWMVFFQTSGNDWPDDDGLIDRLLTPPFEPEEEHRLVFEKTTKVVTHVFLIDSNHPVNVEAALTLRDPDQTDLLTQYFRLTLTKEQPRARVTLNVGNSLPLERAGRYEWLFCEKDATTGLYHAISTYAFAVEYAIDPNSLPAIKK